MKKALVGLFIFSLILLSGCVGKASDKYAFKMIEPIEATDNTFTDNGLIFQFLEVTNQIIFIIKNDTDQLVKIIWDNCVYRGFNNQPSRVIHHGVKYIDKEKPMAPSLIPPRSEIAEGVVPANHISWGSRSWVVTKIINPYSPPAGGEMFSLYFCIERGGEEVFYNFKFIIVKINSSQETGNRINFNPILPNSHYATGKLE